MNPSFARFWPSLPAFPQKCRQYLHNGKWYCSDRCYDGACGKREVCKSRKRKWCRGKGKGCPKKRKCLTYE